VLTAGGGTRHGARAGAEALRSRKAAHQARSASVGPAVRSISSNTPSSSATRTSCLRSRPSLCSVRAVQGSTAWTRTRCSKRPAPCGSAPVSVCVLCNRGQNSTACTRRRCNKRPVPCASAPVKVCVLKLLCRAGKDLGPDAQLHGLAHERGCRGHAALSGRHRHASGEGEEHPAKAVPALTRAGLPASSPPFLCLNSPVCCYRHHVHVCFRRQGRQGRTSQQPARKYRQRLLRVQSPCHPQRAPAGLRC